MPTVAVAEEPSLATTVTTLRPTPYALPGLGQTAFPTCQLIPPQSRRMVTCPSPADPEFAWHSRPCSVMTPAASQTMSSLPSAPALTAPVALLMEIAGGARLSCPRTYA